MKLYWLALTLLIIAAVPGTSNTFNIASFLVFVIAVLRTLWLVWRDPTPLLRKTGEIAAKGANHLDSFKDAFNNARNK